ncbi:MAG: ATP-binding protein [Oscillospiraceae bacterium]|jgi:hypothetical protein|nr:ATP-binding protein [Oscillospiraceae bacterium]
MVQIITGSKGTGKTEILIDKINEVIQTTKGDVICIEQAPKLTYRLSYKVRLVDTGRFGIMDYDSFYGFISGMLASNYDISDIFVDGILRLAGRDYNKLGEVLDRLAKLTEKSTTTVVFTVSADDKDLPESVLKYKSK